MIASADEATADAARQRADGIEGGRERYRAVLGNAARRRLETGKPAQGGRNPHRPSGVAADRDYGHAVGDGDGGARRRAAGNAGAVGRIPRGSVMRVDTDPGERELGHVGAADQHYAGLAQTRDDSRIGARGRSEERRVGKEWRWRGSADAGEK